MSRDARKSADGEKKKEHSRRKAKYLVDNHQKEDDDDDDTEYKEYDDVALVDSDRDDKDDDDHNSDDKPVHASSARADKSNKKKKQDHADEDKKKPKRHGCVVTQPLPVRLASALDAPLCYAQSVRYGKEVTLSGIWAYGRHGLLVADDDDSLSVEERARAQTKQVFRNIHDALVAAGCRGLEDLTSMSVALVDLAATATPFFEERLKIMGDHVEYTSSVVGITGFPVPGGLVHVDAVAVVGRGCPLLRDHLDSVVKANNVKAAHGGVNTSGCVVAYPKPPHLSMAPPGGKPRSALAVRYGKEVTLAGIWAYTERSRLVRGGVREQARQTFKNVHAALIEAGCRGLEDVVSINASLVDVEDTWEAFVQERDRALAPNTDYTSSIVGITGFPVEGGLVYVNVKAVVGRGCLLGVAAAANNARA
ncbi:YjgF/Yer057c/UK114 family protein [Pandoravirus quercus]|uniref:YjgF/Yer057c/UK114 family protein n=1 Tax=Pandoravirus quercus TaxID=2107709 RepID=A0A2U7U9V7_9VIRU|nr:YjgF/Yer057c/UK114 family protein [Pandoravirus quercus]AVK75223.1 YjgF/Yer057c/UK114 family protein [Pandoravirus quercus]